MQQYKVITITSENLPRSLKNLYKPPTALYARGDVSLIDSSTKVGIVGARKFTPYGREVTVNITTSLVRAGVVIISGLALGVDSIAHKACIQARGKTIAVLPSGVDKIYPASHHQLAQEILSTGGLLISEHRGTGPVMKHQFIERNRIIAALSDKLIVTEAARGSGSLHTARFALEQGIDIMAVPGNINSTYSEGTNRLIQNGATPILDPLDILTELGISEDDKPAYIPENIEEQGILKLIRSGMTSTNDLLHNLDLPPQKIQASLTMLEIKGILKVASGQWSLV